MTVILRRTLLAAALVASATGAHAQAAWPTAKPITLIVPFTAGGATDGIARLFAQKLGEQIGQSVVVDNVGGGGGAIGTQKAAKATPDGYTILMAVDSPAAIAQFVNPDAVKYDTQRDFAPVGMLAIQPLVIMGRPGLAANSFKDVIAQAKAEPSKLSYATSGIGTILHLAMERYQQQAGIKLLHVPYRGGAQAITDLIGNQVDMAILPSGSAIPQITAKKAKGLIVTDAHRLAALPDVPSITEVQGFKDLAINSWIGVFAPAKTASAVVEKLNLEMNKVMQLPEVRAKFAELAIVPGSGTAAQFGTFVKNEQARYERIVRDANIRE
ncbi:Bug family tripartite tricarboxylate transporter substrate binding protein [Ottowia thiooxydans]|uniref:Bug family tripartite tricarboxylate transporter substrate binding protein n=1 Tax=Ottowia thiooxydans TaxID=219182 RepID=UPI00041BEC55|nr:tripartite tricarboxylate transporter substrate-binding protein [Ottowia thiooxydans]